MYVMKGSRYRLENLYVENNKASTHNHVSFQILGEPNAGSNFGAQPIYQIHHSILLLAYGIALGGHNDKCLGHKLTDVVWVVGE